MFRASGRTTPRSTRSISSNNVVIAGAGPAGSAAALLLARSGARVTLLDRSAFPRTKICGEYLSPASVRALTSLGVAGRVRADAHVLHGVRLHAGTASVELPFRSEAWSVPRERLDAELCAAAVEAGATLMRARAESAACADGAAAVHVRNEAGDEQTIVADACIAADGAGSLIVRNLGLATPARANARFAMGGHYEGFRALDAAIDMFVDGDSYFAVNPLSRTSANVMLIAPESEVHKHRGDVDGYMRARGADLARGLDFASARLSSKRLATGPLYHRALRLRCDRVLIAGDAARFLDPFTGQGVLLALYAARQAALALQSGDLAAYERNLLRELRRRALLSAVVKNALRLRFLARFPSALRPVFDAVSA